MEEVKEYKYLDFIISNKGREHIKKLRRKSMLTVRKV